MKRGKRGSSRSSRACKRRPSMRLRRARFRNWGPFADLTIDLAALDSTQRLVAITGPNGAGKTSALEGALPGAFYRTCPTRGALVDLARARDAMVESEIVKGSAWTIRPSLDSVSKTSEDVVLDDD